MGIVHAQIAADIRSQLRKKGSTALPLVLVVFCNALQTRIRTDAHNSGNLLSLET